MFLKVCWRMSGVTIRGSLMTAKAGACTGVLAGVAYTLLLISFRGYVDDLSDALIISAVAGMIIGALLTLFVSIMPFFIAAALNPTINVEAWLRSVWKTVVKGMGGGFIFGTAIGLVLALIYHYISYPTWVLPPRYFLGTNFRNWFHAGIAFGYMVGAVRGTVVGEVAGIWLGVRRTRLKLES